MPSAHCTRDRAPRQRRSSRRAARSGMIARRMDLNYVLVWMVLLSAGLAIARGLRAGSARGWLAVAAAIAAATGVALAVAPRVAGYVGGALWGLLVVLPMLGAKLCSRFIIRQEFRQARAVASL